VVPGLTSVVVPSYNYGHYVADAIDSALAQTAPVEVLVVDDGSTDDTAAVLDRYGARIRRLALTHGGPSRARNAGLDAARGEFVMFLDADDVIAPTKVADQRAELTPDIGWVLCDTRIEDEAKGRAENASVKYDYAGKNLGGWIQPQLVPGNFIPIMAPLIRRSVLSDAIRFEDGKVPEDWHFWFAVAGAARMRYLPKVLATYRHRRTGRSRLPKKARTVVPNIVQPLRLNLGCGTPNTRSWHPIPGMVNLDKSLGWTFEDGLGDFIDGSVAGITISHTLMYVAETDWPRVFAEFARVLEPGGVVRITEDETQDPSSTRFGGWQGSQPAVTLTHPAMVKAALERAGLRAVEVTKDTTHFRDRSLLQAQHGDPPQVFFMEGIRVNGVLLAPHSDDETLFASFTLLRYRPRVVVCFGSSGDYGPTEAREAETRDAMTVFGAGPVEQWHGGDLVAQMRAFDTQWQPSRVWAPSTRTSHPDHLAVALAAAEVFGDRVTRYHTYDAGGKVREGRPVEFEVGWAQHKLRALARYESQLRHPRAQQFFLADLFEFQEAP
jgi:hypothetical protein